MCTIFPSVYIKDHSSKQKSDIRICWGHCCGEFLGLFFNSFWRFSLQIVLGVKFKVWLCVAEKSKCSEALCHSKTQKSGILELEVLKQFNVTCRVSNLNFKNHSILQFVYVHMYALAGFWFIGIPLLPTTSLYSPPTAQTTIKQPIPIPNTPA